MIHFIDYINKLIQNENSRPYTGAQYPSSYPILKTNPMGNPIRYTPTPGQDQNGTMMGTLEADTNQSPDHPMSAKIGNQEVALDDDSVPILSLLGYSKKGQQVPFHVVNKTNRYNKPGDWSIGVGSDTLLTKILRKIRER